MYAGGVCFPSIVESVGEFSGLREYCLEPVACIECLFRTFADGFSCKQALGMLCPQARASRGALLISRNRDRIRRTYLCIGIDAMTRRYGGHIFRAKH